jgi:hypothetical protein
MSKKLLTLAIALFATAASAQNLTSNGFSYDYVQGFYESGSISDTAGAYKIESDLSGSSFGVSKLINENVFMTAGFGSLSSDSIKINSTSYAINTDVKATSVGIGYRMAVDSKTDFNVQVGSTSTKVKFNGYGYAVSETDTQTSVGATLRHKIASNVELNVGVRSSDGETSTFVGGGFELSKTLAVIGGYSKFDGGNSTVLGLRVMF